MSLHTYFYIKKTSPRRGGKPSLEHCIPLPRKSNQYNYHGCGWIMLNTIYSNEAPRKGLMHLTLIFLDYNPTQTSLINIT